MLGRPSALTVLAVAACRGEPTAASDEPPLRIAAASDLAHVLPELSARFEARSGRRAVVVFGATGVLARQLEQGAPFDVFAPAHASFLEPLRAQGRCAADSERSIARGRLAVVARRELLGAAWSWERLASADVRTIAIANPEVAPYGRAAREALVSGGVWARIERKVVPTENVNAAFALVVSGNADAAVVSAALDPSKLASTDRGTLGRVLVDPSSHAPIEQAAIACSADPQARAFVELLASAEGRAVFEAAGLSAPRDDARENKRP